MTERTILVFSTFFDDGFISRNMASPSRRSFLRWGAVVVGTGIGGCPGMNNPGGDDDQTSIENQTGVASPDGEPENVPESLQCDDESFQRHFNGYDEDSINWGTTGEYSLTSDDLQYQYGDSIDVTLRYTGSGTGQTGNKYKFNLELFTEAGWEEVRGWSDGQQKPYTDEAVTHEPGVGFDCTIELTESGIIGVATETHANTLEVCPDLKSGRYRFVYWGLPDDAAVGIAFDLRRETSYVSDSPYSSRPM
jgi:hypothetical protein